MSKGEYPGDEVTLWFTGNGTAELVDESDDVLWASDEDTDFREAHKDELLGENDTEMILTYLGEKGIVSGDELGDVAIEVEDAEYEEVDEIEEETDLD